MNFCQSIGKSIVLRTIQGANFADIAMNHLSRVSSMPFLGSTST